MTRVRVALLIVAGAVAALVSLLLLRALGSAAVERQARHAIVSERIFDEMERELSRWLEREEERPLADWRYFSGDPRRAPRSPLSRVSPLSFVIGHFAVDAEGRIHTPLEPRPGAEQAAARERGEWPSAEALARAADTRRSATRFWEWARRGDLGGDENAQAPSEPVPATVPAPAPPLPETGSYQVLQKLNIGGAAREARKRRYAESPAASAVEPEASEDVLDTSGGQAALADAGGLASGALDEAAVAEELLAAKPDEVARKLEQTLAKGARDAAPGEPDAEARREGTFLQERAVDDEESLPWSERFAFRSSPSRSSAERGAPVEVVERAGRVTGPPQARPTMRRVALDPMVGRALEGDPSRLVLYRTAIVRGQALRQGVVLDLDALREYLAERVVAAGGLASSVRVHPVPAPGAAPTPQTRGAYLFFHAFADPFQPLRLWLELDPLPGSGSPGPLYALSALLAIAMLLGLVAVDRMVSLTLDFARRRADFVAAVSHELKTPVTALRMYAEMLRDGLVRDEHQRAEYYGTLADESERLARLVDNVLEFSRLERGQRELAVVAGDLGRAVSEAAERLRPHAERLGFALRVELEPGLPAARFERDALMQVLFNLVDNALKYAAGAERREILVRVERAGDGVLLRVRDFGPGVPSRQLARIFQPFYRGERELTRSTRGTGIGLALVRQLGHAMGAAVSGANAEDGGFEVRLRFGAA